MGCHEAIGPAKPLLGCVCCCFCVPLCLSVLIVFASVWLAGCLVGWLAGWCPGCLAGMLAGSLVCCLACSLLLSLFLGCWPGCLHVPICLVAWLLGCLLGKLLCSSAAWLRIFCMILPLPACMFLCLCLAYAFVSSDFVFDFSDFSGWKRYVPITSHLPCFCFWLPSCMRCTMYMYGFCQTLSIFHFRFFFSKIFWGPLCGAPNAPQIIFHEGGLFIGYEKNVVIKEALGFERPAFCDFP